jgi:uncharacterized protein YjbI with pentapeptide repeats
MPSLWLIYDFSGIRLIWSKILPPKETEKTKRKPSTFLLWMIGIYVALFGITSQLYENKVDIIENRANAIFNQLGSSSESVNQNALGMISRAQNMECPQKPYVFKPGTVIGSLLYRPSRNKETVELLKDIVENWKENLDGVNLYKAQLKKASLARAKMIGGDFRKANLWRADLRWANLSKGNLLNCYLLAADLLKADLSKADLRFADFRWANLQKANLKGAKLYGIKLRGANLKNAKGITLEMLLGVKTLYKVKGLDPKIKAKIKAQKPELFHEPKSKK